MPAKGGVCDRRRPLDPRRGLEPGHDLLVERVVGAGRRRSGRRRERRELDEHEPVRGQAHLDRLEPDQAACEQAGGRHDRHRERDLRDHQPAAAAPRARPRADGACSVELRGQIDPAQECDRCHPRERGDQEHDAERDESDLRVRAHRLEPRQAAGHERHHRPQQEPNWLISLTAIGFVLLRTGAA